MSTKTFGPSFSERLVDFLLSVLHAQVSAQTYSLIEFLIRKCGHFTEYSIFAIFLYQALSGRDRFVWRPRRALACVILAGLYSLTDEFHQRFVPGRGPSIVDCGYDTLGATLGILILYFWKARFPRGAEQRRG